jgi:hypothetical protein
MVINKHYLIREPHTIGWDIAITPEGPVIIELNRYPDVDFTQACCGGWRNIFNEY